MLPIADAYSTICQEVYGSMPTTAVDAQREGFEPPEPFGSPVFKTGTISQTRTSLHTKITTVCFYAKLSIKLRLRQA